MSHPSSRAVDAFTRAEEAAQFILARTTHRPRIALVLGSGLGGFADQLQDAIRIPYREIPHYPVPGAVGHAGQLVIGKLGDVTLAAMQGRVHFYEGYPMEQVVFPMRVFGRMGVKAAVLTNAAGGMNLDYKQGCLVVIRDHINLQGTNPLIGPNDDRLGPRFFDMQQAYWPEYRKVALAEGRKLGIDIFEGVYAVVTGPSYETPAEIRYFRQIGADLIGMSTVPEVIVARHMGLKVLAISCVTNMAAGVTGEPINHEEVLETGRRVQGMFVQLMQAVIPAIAADVA